MYYNILPLYCMHVEGDMSDVKLEIPEDLLCGRAPNEDNTGTTNIRTNVSKMLATTLQCTLKFQIAQLLWHL